MEVPVPERKRGILKLKKKLTEQENENKFLKDKVAELEREVGNQCVTIFLLKTFFAV